VRNIVSFFVKNPDQARLMFNSSMCDPQKFPLAHQAGMETFNRLVSLIQRGQTEGHIHKKDDPIMLALMIWSSIHGTAMLMLENQFKTIDNAPEVQLDVFVKFTTERLLKGLQ
jgi:Tetracyclin repressor-like, C-terminal domain